MELPKFSQFMKPLALPESQFEDLIKSTLGIEVPPGPSQMVSSLLEGFEQGQMLQFPSGQFITNLPQLPSLSQLLQFPFGGGQTKQESYTASKPPEQQKQTPAPPRKPSQRLEYKRKGKIY